MDIAVQKGGVPGVSGCIEHTSVLTQIIREAREGKGELAVKKRGTVGKTVRDNCECKIISQADSWMVPGWELITPVGAPLEVVVDSAETTEEGGST